MHAVARLFTPFPKNAMNRNKRMLLLAGLIGGACLAATDKAVGQTTEAPGQPASVQRPYVNEMTVYTDLRSGRTFRVVRDPASGNYNAQTGEPLDFYVNTETRDTFYGPGGLWVNGAMFNNAGTYSVDYDRVRQRDAGYASPRGTTPAGDKVKVTEGELKAKSANGDRKTKVTDEERKFKSGDGETKIKETSDEYKAKSAEGGNKVKMTEDELKAKSSDGAKVKLNENEGKMKGADGTKIKSNGNETKIKTEDMKVKEKNGRVRVKQR